MNEGTSRQYCHERARKYFCKQMLCLSGNQRCWNTTGEMEKNNDKRNTSNPQCRHHCQSVKTRNTKQRDISNECSLHFLCYRNAGLSNCSGCDFLSDKKHQKIIVEQTSREHVLLNSWYKLLASHISIYSETRCHNTFLIEDHVGRISSPCNNATRIHKSSLNTVYTRHNTGISVGVKLPQHHRKVIESQRLFQASKRHLQMMASMMQTPTGLLLMLLPLILAGCSKVDASSIDYTPVISTRYGQLRGAYQDVRGAERVATYLGIPYATPPVAANRFSPTRAPSQWRSVLDATNQPPACPQTPPEPYRELLQRQSEDCLYLNLYVPGKYLQWLERIVFNVEILLISSTDI